MPGMSDGTSKRRDFTMEVKQKDEVILRLVARLLVEENLLTPEEQIRFLRTMRSES